MSSRPRQQPRQPDPCIGRGAMATPATTIRLLACFAVAACLLMVHSGSRLVAGPERIRSGKLERADEEVGALRRQLEAARAEAAAAATEARAATRRAEAAEAAEAKALAQAAAAALPRRTASSGPGEGLSGFEEANGRLLSRDDILARVPVGQPAFFTVANSAYADLAENWALLLRPLLRGTTAGHMFVASLDGALATRLLARRLPTLRVGLGSNDTGRAPPQSKAPPVEVSANFRLKFSMFRARDSRQIAAEPAARRSRRPARAAPRRRLWGDQGGPHCVASASWPAGGRVGRRLRVALAAAGLN